MQDDNENSFEELEQEAKKVLTTNLVQGKGYTYVCPDLHRYPHQWFWDSCFHVIVNSHVNMTIAKAEFETLIKRQEKDGFIAHMNYWKQGFNPMHKMFTRYYKNKETSSLTQPAVLAQALRSIWDKSKEKNFLNDHLEAVKKYYDYVYATRRIKDDPVQLINIIHTWESGIDNSPIYDKALSISGKFLTLKWLRSLFKQLKVLKGCNWELNQIFEKDYFIYKDLLYNCLYIQGCRELSYLLNQAGRKSDGEQYMQRARLLEDAFIKYCWNSDKNCFFNLYGKSNKMDDVKSAMSLVPLILEGLPPNMSYSLVEDHLLNEKEFWTNYPVPSVAIDEPSYSEGGPLLWRGPTWININWMIIKGLKQHGFENVAIELASRTIDLVKKHGFREFYNPRTGEGMGAKLFGWSTLVIDIQKTILEDKMQDFILNQDWRHIKKGGLG